MMQDDLECTGKIRLGDLPPEVSECLSRFNGTWLEFSPEEKALVVRHVQPAGCPVLGAVPCELITLLDQIPAAFRDALPGGDFLIVGSTHDRLIRITLNHGEIRVQWAHPDYSQARRTHLADVLAGFVTRSARVNGAARFAGTGEQAQALEDFVDRYEGLYPREDVVCSVEGDTVSARFLEVNVGPEELLQCLQRLAQPAESLEADLDVSSFAPISQDHLFRICIRKGQVEILKPDLWKRE